MKKENVITKVIIAAAGFFAGMANGLFGSGGGIIMVPTFTKSGFEQEKAQAEALLCMLSFCVVSIIFYFIKGNINLGTSYKYMLGGAVGGAFGGVLLGKFKSNTLKLIFAAFALYAGFKFIMTA